MSRILSDQEIVALLAEEKVLDKNWKRRLEPRAKEGHGHKRRKWSLEGATGHSFRIDVRDNPRSLFDFSIILTFVDVGGEEYTLVRFNGKHSHTNKWERKHNQPNAEFKNALHVHRATERYQTDPECKIDGFAEVTNTYHSFDSALQAFVKSNGFQIEPDVPEGRQKPLFDDAG